MTTEQIERAVATQFGYVRKDGEWQHLVYDREEDRMMYKPIPDWRERVMLDEILKLRLAIKEIEDRE